MAARRKTITEKSFAKLASELRALLDATNRSASAEKTLGYWKVGARIARERLLEDAGYHNSVLSDLSRELGVSARTLRRTVLFHRSYPLGPQGELTWMHYQILSSVQDGEEREFYQGRALEEKWSIRQLRDAVGADLYQSKGATKPRLRRPDSLDYCYLARLEAIVDGDTFDFDVDLGFSVWTKRRIRLARIDCPEIDTPEGRAARNFAASHLTRASTIVLKSTQTDLYGRYVADVFFTHQQSSLKSCFTAGRYLNDLLLTQEHAVLVR